MTSDALNHGSRSIIRYGLNYPIPTLEAHASNYACYDKGLEIILPTDHHKAKSGLVVSTRSSNVYCGTVIIYYHIIIDICNNDWYTKHYGVAVGVFYSQLLVY